MSIDPRSLTIQEVQIRLNRIYGEKNKKRELLLICAKLMEKIRRIAQPTRKEEQVSLIHGLVNVYSWTNALATSAGIDIADELWKKYPGVCHYCLALENCNCIALKDKPKPDLERLTRFVQENKKPETMNDFQVILEKIYGRINSIPSFQQLFIHLCEEMSETQEAVNNIVEGELNLENKNRLGAEIADITARILGIFTRGVIIKGHLWLSEFIIQEYPDWTCSHCHQKQCQCGAQKGPVYVASTVVQS